MHIQNSTTWARCINGFRVKTEKLTCLFWWMCICVSDGVLAAYELASHFCFQRLIHFPDSLMVILTFLTPICFSKSQSPQYSLEVFENKIAIWIHFPFWEGKKSWTVQSHCGSHCTVPCRITSFVISLWNAYQFKNRMCLFQSSFYFGCGGNKTRKNVVFKIWKQSFFCQEWCVEL